MAIPSQLADDQDGTGYKTNREQSQTDLKQKEDP